MPQPAPTNVARMTIEPIDPAGLPDDRGNYTHGTLVTGASRTVYVSGQPEAAQNWSGVSSLR